MDRKIGKIFLISLAAFAVAEAQLAVAIQEPKIGNFLYRLTNTTFDLIRSGVNIFGKAVDKIITTFQTIEERFQALLELLRQQLIKGVPELNIPILDPLHINRIDFDLKHEAAKAKGNAQDVTVRGISSFHLDKQDISDLGKLRFKLILDLTFPFIKVNGTYKIDGMIGETFQIFGEGPFRLNLIDLKIQTVTILVFNLPARLRVENIKLNVRLKQLENNFENLMNDAETGSLFNKAISTMAPEALKILWPEIKPSVELQVKNYINSILENATIVNLAKRLFNII